MEIDRLQDHDAPLARADAAREAAADIEPDLDEPDKRAARVDNRAAVEAAYLEEAREHWRTAAKPAFEQEWTDYKEAHALPEHPAATIEEAAADSVRQGCGEIRKTEDKIVTPAMHRIEAEDPDRHLVGLEFRCKGEDRIMEKVANWMAAQPDLTPDEALALVKDPIRYTFQYTEEHYTEGVNTDVDRLKTAGFELVELRNSWEAEEYKGINSRWRVPGNGQLFEVQFHTQISFEAKQLTHPAYERLRNPLTSVEEQDELADFQRRVNARVPEPPGVREVPNYP